MPFPAQYQDGIKVQARPNVRPKPEKWTAEDANAVIGWLNELKQSIDNISSNLDAQQISDALDALFSSTLWRQGGADYLGEHNDLAALKAAYPTGTQSQYALVGTQADRSLAVWNSAASEWIAIGGDEATAVQSFFELSDVQMDGASEGSVPQVSSSNTIIPLGPARPLLTITAAQNDIKALTFTDNEAVLGVAGKTYDLTESQYFADDDYEYKVFSVSESDATIRRYPFTQSAPAPAATTSIGIGIGGATAVTESTSPSQFVIKSSGTGSNLSTASDVVGFFPLQPLTMIGASLIVKFTATSNARSNGTKVGLMLRSGLDPEATFASVEVLNNSGSDIGKVRKRDSRGATATDTSMAGTPSGDDNIGPSLWIRITLTSGSEIEAQMDYSEDFSSPNTETISIATKGLVYAGVFLCSGNGTEQEVEVEQFYFE